jgi:2-polyprenyl-3-methyl-5-hydroxy-6-metoxy-1,4-benzoquinol methylase
MQLPTEIELRHCNNDNFLFLAGGRQSDYDEYYAAVANDSYHQEVSDGSARSPISALQNDHLVSALGDFFTTSQKVLDFGCGEASLLVELAINFPSSTLFGFEPGPAQVTASHKAKTLHLDNLSVVSLDECTKEAPYDLIIVSHVFEHLLDFELVHLLHGMLTNDGWLYVEVPNAQDYSSHQRVEFLYYFDRLHVNHFTPQALSRLLANFGFGYIKHFEYAFPYRDGGDYSALGMIFQKGGDSIDITSPRIIDSANRYVDQEKVRAKTVANRLASFEGVLIWGVGDNFYRSIENGGPLVNLTNLVLLDRRPQEVIIGERVYQTVAPETGILQYSWPVVVTISEGRKEISRQITNLDPNRHILYT